MPFGVPTKYKPKRAPGALTTGPPSPLLKLKPGPVKPAALKAKPATSFAKPAKPKVRTKKQIAFRRATEEIRAANLARDLGVKLTYRTVEDSPGTLAPDTLKLFEEAHRRQRMDLVRKHFGPV